MKKMVLIMALFIIVIFYQNTNKNEIIIPDESIRFRIIPNSNSVLDITMKEKVKEKINREVNLLQGDSIEEARSNLKNTQDKISVAVNNVFKENNYNQTFNVNYGYNYFPEKKYKGVTYKEGNYESLVVEIGKAKGDNFWCVLFPPLCMMDSEKNNVNDKKYKFFISEIINKYF